VTTYIYRSEVLDQLARHGIRPGASTSPERVRTAVRDLYNYEIRRARDRVRRGWLAKAALADEVIVLRRRYWLLSIPVHEWLTS
jgi:hypothetical protein